MPWKSRLVVAGAVHAFKPVWLTLDWPTIALILSGVLLLFVPLEDIGSVIESLEFGKTKLTLRKVKQLDQSVERAVSSGIAAAAISAPADAPEDEDEPRAAEPPSPARVPRSAWGDFFEDPPKPDIVGYRPRHDVGTAGYRDRKGSGAIGTGKGSRERPTDGLEPGG